MHFTYVQLQLLRFAHALLIFTIMMLSPVLVDSRTCNGAVRTIRLFSDFTKGLVRVEGRKVVASSSMDYFDHTLQIITIDVHSFLLYDPRANMFICWNKSFNNLIAKRNPRVLYYCKFEEKTSLRRPADMTRYTTVHFDRTGGKREVEMRFNKAGSFAYPRLVRKCLQNARHKRTPQSILSHHQHNNHHHHSSSNVTSTHNKHRHNHNNHPHHSSTRHQHQHHPVYHPIVININETMNLNTLHPLNEDQKRAYLQVTRLCADPDFVVHVVHRNSVDCAVSYMEFCERMTRIHQHHRIHSKLSGLCNL